MKMYGQGYHRHPRRFSRLERHAYGVATRCRRRPEAPFRRRFFTRDERISGLEQYLTSLRAEAQAVEEKLTRLKAAS